MTPTLRFDFDVGKVRHFGDGRTRAAGGRAPPAQAKRPGNADADALLSPFHDSNADFPDSVVRALRRKLKLTPAHGISDAAWQEA